MAISQCWGFMRFVHSAPPDFYYLQVVENDVAESKPSIQMSPMEEEKVKAVAKADGQKVRGRVCQ